MSFSATAQPGEHYDFLSTGIMNLEIPDGVTFLYSDSGYTPRSPEQSIPEPATFVLFGIGLAGLGFARKKKKSA